MGKVMTDIGNAIRKRVAVMHLQAESWGFSISELHYQMVTMMIGISVMGLLILGKTKFIRLGRSLMAPAAFMYVFIRAIYLVWFPTVGEMNANVLSMLLVLAKAGFDVLIKYHSVLAAIVGDITGLLLLFSLTSTLGAATNLKFSVVKKRFLDAAYDAVKWLPIIQKEVQKEQHKLEEHFEDHLKKKSRAIGLRYQTLPPQGVATASVLSLMQDVTKQEDQIWQAGKVSGAIYHGGSDHVEFLNSAFGCYSIANPLHPDIWPSGMKFEAEIIAMTAALVDGSYGEKATAGPITTKMSTVCGCTTSGGTESIILAIKAHRDYYSRRHGITRPELVCCVSAHAAVDKACEVLGITLIKVPMCPQTCQISIPAVRRAVGANTIMLYGSAPSFPQGAIDPITQLAAIARQQDIGLHVDCCLGGFVLPFAKKLGYPVPPFDFSVPGVTSMSLDTHKYGYALKGTSVLLYAHRALRHAQYFCYADWTGGLYTTPTLAGSRSGGLIAQTWASLVSVGEDGFLRNTKAIWETTRRIAEGVKCIPGLRLLGGSSSDGTPDAMIVCFAAALVTAVVSERVGGDKGGEAVSQTATATAAPTIDHQVVSTASVTVTINIYAVSDAMAQKGWSLNPLQHPPCVHLCCTLRHVDRAEGFLSDLQACVSEVIAATAAAEAAQGSKKKEEGNAAIYGMTSSLPPGPVNDLLRTYNDVIFKV